MMHSLRHTQFNPLDDDIAYKRTVNVRHLILPVAFTGKERDEETGYGYFGARYMDHELMTMWLSVDPLADKYPSISPYAYCAWNPILFIDPDGEEKLICYNTNAPKQSSFKGKGAWNRFQKAMASWRADCNLEKSAQKYKDYNGVIHLFAHGSSQRVDLANHGSKDAVGLEVFLGNNSKTYQKNIMQGKQETTLLIMHACSTGKGENPIAQQLSKNVEELLIFAPSEDALLGRDETVENNGVWNVFYKGELLGSYKGDTDFRRELEEKGSQKIIESWVKKYEEKYDNN